MGNADIRRIVLSAWKEEKKRVAEGKGTCDWGICDQTQIMSLNFVPGYCVQFLTGIPDAKKVQFLPFSNYVYAHDGRYAPNKYGYYDIDADEYLAYSKGGNKPLSKPEYGGGIQNNRRYFAGTVNKFGIAILFDEKKTNKTAKKFGLTKALPVGKKSPVQRKNKFGF